MCECVWWVSVNVYMDRYGLCVSLQYLHPANPNLTQRYGQFSKTFIRSFFLLSSSLVPIPAGQSRNVISKNENPF